MSTWTNNDGLYIRFGTTESEVTNAGSYSTGVAGQHVTEVRIPDATDITADPSILANSTIIPAGATISKVEVISETAATSDGSAVLNVGLIRLDRTTELDYEAFVKAAPVADFAADGNIVTYTQGSDEHGDLVGTKLVYAGLVTADYTTAAFTAGEFVIRIYWYID